MACLRIELGRTVLIAGQRQTAEIDTADDLDAQGNLALAGLAAETQIARLRLLRCEGAGQGRERKRGQQAGVHPSHRALQAKSG